MVLCKEGICIVLLGYFLHYLVADASVQDPRPGSEGIPKISETVRVRKGNDALLRCDVKTHSAHSEPPPYVIEWFKGGVPIFIKVGKHPPHVNRDFEERIRMAGDSNVNASLRIFNLTESDDGWYECRILFLQDRFDKASNVTWIKLEVTDPPTFLQEPPPLVESRQGQSLLLKCRATGRPRPVITWRKDGWLVKDGQNGIRLSGGDLAVTSLTTSHRGKYTCRAQSVEGQIQSTSIVRVKAPPEFVTTPSNTTSEEGQDAMFSCRATGHPPYMKYSWYYNGVMVEDSKVLRGRYSSLEDGTLIIYHVNTKDKGSVTCRVDNGYGIPPSASAFLSVQFKARVSQMPALVYAGLKLKAVLKCPSEAEPPVNKVIWRKSGLLLSPNQDPRISMNGNGSLIITSASPRDAGRYTCTPFNMLGTLGESTASRLIVRDPPYFTLKPKPSYEFEIGKPASIPCRGGGDPPPAVTWRKVLSSGESLQYLVEQGNITIPSVKKSDHGLWQCVLVNSVAEVTRNVQILVKYTGPHRVSNVSVLPMSNTAVRVSWAPGYNGGHKQHFMIWYKQSDKGDHSWQILQVEGTHRVAIVENLEPNTPYEFSVLPENKLQSGPFSDTVVVRTLALKPPVKLPDNALLAPPQALFSSKTEEGYIRLSWRKPYSSGMGRRMPSSRSEIAPSPYSAGAKLLGFLVEYKWTGADPVTGNTDSYDRNPGEANSRSKREAVRPLPEKNRWETLATTYDNITTIIVQPEKIYRDLMYEFRVLSVSNKEYSPPSNPVSVSTKGLTAYPCYTGIVDNAALFGHPIVAGVIAAICLMALLVVILIICYCRKKKLRMKSRCKPGEVRSGIVVPNTNHMDEEVTKPTTNGNIPGSKHAVIVDLTNGGPGGYPTMEKREYEAPVSSSEDARTSFLGPNSAENSGEDRDQIFRSFLSRHGIQPAEEFPPKEQMSDRSSVRMRRETTARILTAQLKRRSFTEQTRHKMRRDIPLRGGVRSASTSPERGEFSFARPENLNVTSPAALGSPTTQGQKRKIRLYSRPIDEEGTGQQRRMIVIKRKSQRSSSSERLKGCDRAPPSDSSESPVFGVVGTIKESGVRGRENTNVPTSGSKQNIKSSFKKSNGALRSRNTYSPHKSNTDDDVFGHSDDVTKYRSDDDVIDSWDSPISKPILSSSPKEVSPTSPQSNVSPNRVVARHTVAYDPCNDPSISPRTPANTSSATERVSQWVFNEANRTNSLNRRRDSMHTKENSRTSYNYSPQADFRPFDDAMHSPSPYDRYPQGVVVSLQSPHYHQQNQRYSLAQRPSVHSPLSPQYYQQVTLNRSFIPNTARSRASYTYGHQPLSLPPPKGLNVSAPPVPAPNAPTSNPVSRLNPPQSTLEIDCSNSDIEVRFVKDPNGKGYVRQARDPRDNTTSYDQEGSGEMLNRTPMNRDSPMKKSISGSRITGTGNPKTMDPRKISVDKSGNPELQYNLCNPVMSASPHCHQSSSPEVLQGSGSGPKERPRNLVSPPRYNLTSPVRHVKLKSSGPDPPTSPPLGGIGSSDYGSQDTSNSSTSPNIQLGIAQNLPTSPLHNRVLGLSQERPPRRDNSSVEDNYEWDSEIAMESEILEALRHFGTLKKTGPVSDELLDELNKITKETKREMEAQQRPQSADVLETVPSKDEENQEGDQNEKPTSPEQNYSKESMARRCAALRAEFLHYQKLQQLDEDDITSS